MLSQTVLQIAFFAIGGVGGYLLKHYTLGIPADMLTAIQSYLVAHHRQNLANIIKGVQDGEAAAKTDAPAK